MTKQEIDRKKEIAAAALLHKSGVGSMFAKGQLTEIYLDMVRELGLAGSDDEAIVKVALQFAFSNIEGLCEFCFKQCITPAIKREFRVVR